MKLIEKRRFGIELELSRMLTRTCNQDRKHHPNWKALKIRLNDLARNGFIAPGWSFKTDVSCGGEAVSPILLGVKGRNSLADVVVVCNMIAEFARDVGLPPADGECGLHMHIDASNLSPHQLGRLVVIAKQVEPIIYEMFPHRDLTYCLPVEINPRLALRWRDMIDVRDTWFRGSNNTKKRDMHYSHEFINGTSSADRYDGTRYHGLNLHSLWRIGTVEFRWGVGTFDIEHIVGYISLCCDIMDAAISDNINPILPHDLTPYSYKKMARVLKSQYLFREFLISIFREFRFSRNTRSFVISRLRSVAPSLLLKSPMRDFLPKIIPIRHMPFFCYRDEVSGYRFDYNGNLSHDRQNGREILCRAVWLQDDKISLRPVGRYNISLGRPVIVTNNNTVEILSKMYNINKKKKKKKFNRCPKTETTNLEIKASTLIKSLNFTSSSSSA